MREIKFRLWDTFNERMVHDYHRFFPSAEHDKQEGDPRFDAPYQFYEKWYDEEDGVNRPCQVMQYTGLKDKKGKEIFEGDIVSLGTTLKGTLIGWPVVYHHDGFKIGQSKYTPRTPSKNFWRRCEIVGNIFNTPELLQP